MKRLALSSVLVLPLLASCGTEKNYALTISLDAAPVVIDTAFTYISYRDPVTLEPTYTTIQPSWFLAGYTAKNDGDKTVTIVSLTVEVDIPADLTTNPDAQKTVGTCDFVADVTTSGQTYLAVVEPGTSAVIAKNLYCSGLQFPKGGPYQTSGRIYPKGWLGSPTSAEDRLKVDTISFTTK